MTSNTPGGGGETPPFASEPQTVLIMGRLENFWPLLICAVFALVGLWLAIMGERVGWFGVLFFGAGAGFLGWQEATRERWRLEIGDDGFTIVNPFNRFAVPFAQISEFGVWKHRGGLRVAWRLEPGAAFGSLAGRAGRLAGGGWDGALPASYGRSATSLRILLEDRWRQARQGLKG